VLGNDRAIGGVQRGVDHGSVHGGREGGEHQRHAARLRLVATRVLPGQVRRQVAQGGLLLVRPRKARGTGSGLRGLVLHVFGV